MKNMVIFNKDQDFTYYKKSFGKKNKSNEEICKCFYFILLNFLEIIEPKKKYINKFEKYYKKINDIIWMKNDYKLHLLVNNEDLVKSITIIILNFNKFINSKNIIKILKKLTYYYSSENKSYFIKNLNIHFKDIGFFDLLVEYLEKSKNNFSYYKLVKIFIRTHEYYILFLNYFLRNKFIIRKNENINLIIIELLNEILNPKIKLNKKLLNMKIKQNLFNLKNYFSYILEISNYFNKRSLLHLFLKIVSLNNYIKYDFVESEDLFINILVNFNKEFDCIKIIFIKLIIIFIKFTKNPKIKKLIVNNNKNIVFLLNNLHQCKKLTTEEKNDMVEYFNKN